MIKIVSIILATFVLGTVAGAFVGVHYQEERRETRDTVDNFELNLVV